VPNPLDVALKGKGFGPVLARAWSILRRYGLSATKMDQELALLQAVLDEFGVSATLPVTAVALARNAALVQKYNGKGTEFALHGLVHVDHRQLDAGKQRDHFLEARQIFEKAGVPVTGFRSPYLRWNDETVNTLAECGFAYDSSQALFWDVTNGLKTDAYDHVLEFYDAWPAAQHPVLPSLEGSIVRIPYCLPDDEALVERLHVRDSEAMAGMWLEILDRTHRNGELFTIGLHPERATLCCAALRATLAKARAMTPAVWVARLDEIAEWWRALADTRFEVHPQGGGRFTLAVESDPRAILLSRGVKMEAPVDSWYGQEFATEAHLFSFSSEKRPVVGLAPRSAPALRSFLRQQGYLAEISTRNQDYAVFLDEAEFCACDQRPLLERLEATSGPLIRVWRWPSGARSALAVTGDIDAFNLWDYVLRFAGR
jgi:hypothetical protein